MPRDSEQPGGRELCARRERLLVVVDVQAAQEVVFDAGAEHDTHLALAQRPLARAQAAQARVTPALGELRRLPAGGAPLHVRAARRVEDLDAVLLELADASGEARERLGPRARGLRQVDLAVVQQSGDVAQRGAAAPLGVLDRVVVAVIYPSLCDGAGAVFVSIVGALLGR
ncbi:MAG TPA: hypothetical protein VGO80_06245 [Solirubrobacteraceae bacterium]|nr:hypothetical protein [Solirubrobacteraceae bacterium]